MVILLLFNDSSKMAYKEIAEATGIPAPDLKRNLAALTSAKHKVCIPRVSDQQSFGSL